MQQKFSKNRFFQKDEYRVEVRDCACFLRRLSQLGDLASLILFFSPKTQPLLTVKSMDKRTDKGDQKQKGSDELDLTALRDFNFAANWSESAAPPVRKEESGRSGGGRRERRPDRRPAGTKEMRSHGGHRNEPRSGGGRPLRRGRDQRRQEAPGAVLLRENPFEIQLFPDEPVLETLTKAMRQSIRTYELFEVARLILEKNDRFHVSFRFKQDP